MYQNMLVHFLRAIYLNIQKKCALYSNYGFRFKVVFQLRVFYTYVHARKSLNHFNITFEENNCFDGQNSAFSTI